MIFSLCAAAGRQAPKSVILLLSVVSNSSIFLWTIIFQNGVKNICWGIKNPMDWFSYCSELDYLCKLICFVFLIFGFQFLIFRLELRMFAEVQKTRWVYCYFSELNYPWKLTLFCRLELKMFAEAQKIQLIYSVIFLN